MRRAHSRRPRRVPSYVVYEFPSELQALEFRRAALRDGFQASMLSTRAPWRITAIDDGTSTLDDLAHRHGAQT